MHSAILDEHFHHEHVHRLISHCFTIICIPFYNEIKEGKKITNQKKKKPNKIARSLSCVSTPFLTMFAEYFCVDVTETKIKIIPTAF